MIKGADDASEEEFYHEPHEHHELLAHILSPFVLVRVVRGKKIGGIIYGKAIPRRF
jgi:hypothetical protein